MCGYRIKTKGRWPMANTRNAGRKRKLDTKTVRNIIKERDNGSSMSELAKKYGVSRQTMSFYIHEVAAEIAIERTSEVETFIHELTYWKRLNKDFNITQEELEKYKVRYDYMLDRQITTSILVDFKNENVIAKNYSSHPMKRAFGVKRKPTWEDFVEFVEERCVPKSRDHMKLILRDYGLSTFDPFSIIEKTGGRMAEDNRYIRIYRLET